MAADSLQLGIRVYDPLEKAEAWKSVSFVTVDVERADRNMKIDAFIAKYIKPNLGRLLNLPLELEPEETSADPGPALPPSHS